MVKKDISSILNTYGQLPLNSSAKNAHLVLTVLWQPVWHQFYSTRDFTVTRLKMKNVRCSYLLSLFTRTAVQLFCRNILFTQFQFLFIVLFVLQISRTVMLLVHVSPLMRSDNLSTGCVSWYFGSVPSWDDNRKRTSEWMFVNKTSIPWNLMYW